MKQVQPFWMDTSSFVQAHRKLYPPDEFGDFWSFIAEKISEGSICSCHKVYEEILKGEEKDNLRQFTMSRRSHLCIFPNPTIQVGYRIIADHIKTSYPARQWAAFLDGGDAWVIACAMKAGGTVVTEESKFRKGKIKIPEVCQELEVPFMNISKMLKHFDVQFSR